MHKQALTVLWLLIATLSGMFVFVGNTHAQERVNFRLDFRLVGYHLPFYWAKAKGYYEREGLVVDIKEGAGSGQTINLVVAKEADIGLADLMLMANGVSKGMQIKSVYGLIQVNPWAVISFQDAGIRTPQNLEGKSVAVIAANRTLLDLLLRKNNVAADKITIRTVNVAVRNTIFAEGKADSFVSVAIGTPTDLVVMAQEGKLKPLHFMHFSEFGVAPLGHGLLVHNDTLAKNPDMIRKFIRATNRGIEDTLKPANVDEAIDIALRESGVNAEKRTSLKLQWAGAIKTLQTTHSKGHPYGWMSEKDWAVTLDILKSTEGAVPSANQLYTNDLIPAR